MHTATPDLFNVTATRVAYDPNAPEPTKFLKFLDQVLGEQDAIDTLQELMGYTLSPDTSLQKMALLFGPPRSGKGTIMRLWEALLGAESVISPTMNSLGRDFGLQPFINKSLAFISDMRIGQRTDKAVVAERLLSISGEDIQTVSRKHIDAWTGKLATRIIILTNELPALTEGSGALANRFIIIRFIQSFLGREDPNLTNKLLPELPGILNWAIEGYHRLCKRGHFVQPANAKDLLEHLEHLGSPTKSFLTEYCVVGPHYRVEKQKLYDRWRYWCEENDKRDIGSLVWFARNLVSAIPNLTSIRPEAAQKGGPRPSYFVGVAFTEDAKQQDKQHNLLSTADTTSH